MLHRNKIKMFPEFHSDLLISCLHTLYVDKFGNCDRRVQARDHKLAAGAHGVQTR
jgi:hypothetical protein